MGEILLNGEKYSGLGWGKESGDCASIGTDGEGGFIEIKSNANDASTWTMDVISYPDKNIDDVFRIFNQGPGGTDYNVGLMIDKMGHVTFPNKITCEQGINNVGDVRSAFASVGYWYGHTLEMYARMQCFNIFDLYVIDLHAMIRDMDQIDPGAAEDHECGLNWGAIQNALGLPSDVIMQSSSLMIYPAINSETYLRADYFREANHYGAALLNRTEVDGVTCLHPGRCWDVKGSFGGWPIQNVRIFNPGVMWNATILAKK